MTIDIRDRDETASRVTSLDATIERTQTHLLGLQYPEGYWWGELESNATIEAEYIMLMHFLGVADWDRVQRLARHILKSQRPDGTWGQFYGAPGDLSTSAECYFALKLAGYSADMPEMRRARSFILSKGGIPQTRVFTKIWLALFGQWEWRGVPVPPPELIMLPKWFPLNIYDFASWARATVVPMLILLNRKPVRPVPGSAAVDDLYPLPRAKTDFSVRKPARPLGWASFFYTADSALRLIEKLPWKPARAQSLRKAEQWVLEHQEADGSWGGIQPPWVYSLMALSSLGYPSDHPVIARGMKGFESFAVEEGDTMRLQACISPLWDTGLAMVALLDSGLAPDDPALVKAADWLIDKQIQSGGDWQVRAPGVAPGGWSFEFHNRRYPDLDDTTEIVMALERVAMKDNTRKREAVDRAVHWTLGMQSRNGGWGAFDKDNTKRFIARIPFADFGETIDPPSVDVTAHVIEMMGILGHDVSHPAVSKAMKYVMADQESDGPWFGRWGVNYIYGTAAVLPALAALGLPMGTPQVRRAVDWLEGCQNPDGGWGESCASYVDPAFRGKGPSTASQTAWALIALVAAGEARGEAARRGAEYLARTQTADGSWDEPYFTGAGFPGYGIGQRLDHYPAPGEPGYQGVELPSGFMINYHLYRSYWPLMALGRYRRAGPPVV